MFDEPEGRVKMQTMIQYNIKWSWIIIFICLGIFIVNLSDVYILYFRIVPCCTNCAVCLTSPKGEQKCHDTILLSEVG